VRYWDGNSDGDYLDTNEGAQFYCQDANYNVTAVVNSSGTVLERYSYSPYGEVTFLNPDFSLASSQYSSAIGNTHLYTGRERDPETGLQLNRHRYYASHLGRWLTRDPIEYEGSQWNLYEYVESAPTLKFDPSGQQYNPTKYGNYCGSGSAPGRPRPRNQLDACCQTHDDCYTACGGPSGLLGVICPDSCRRDCDCALAACAAGANCNWGFDCNLYRTGVIAIFGANCGLWKGLEQMGQRPVIRPY
jgi:RHS repeat-associated protein